MKECRPCNWCCYFPAGIGLAKKINEWCKYVIPGVGCSIYDIRPKCCHFECVWKQDKYLTDEFRPDKCGVMFEISSDPNIITGLIDPNRPDAWKSKRIKQLTNKFNKVGYRVFMRTSHGSSNL